MKNVNVKVRKVTPEFKAGDIVKIELDMGGLLRDRIVVNSQNGIEGETYDLTNKTLTKIVNIIPLDSVGCYVDSITLITAPDLYFNISECIHVDERTDEWFSRLDTDDFGTIKNLIDNR